MNKIEQILFSNVGPEAARMAIINNAHLLIKAVQRRNPEWTPPPFDPMLYTSVMNIPVHYENIPEEWDALYMPLPGRKKIIVNKRIKSLGRRRFSLAHEIVHAWFEDPAGTRYVMRARNRREYERDEAAQALERCCDAGAAELLMPQPWFGKELEKSVRKAAAVPKLAQVFEVSLEAAAMRMVESSDSPCGVGFFEFGPRPSENAAPLNNEGNTGTPRYRVRRLFKSAEFPFLFPAGKSVSEESVIYRCSLGPEEMSAVEEFHLGSHAARLHVSAFPLHRDNQIAGPPTVCAVFSPA